MAWSQIFEKSFGGGMYSWSNVNCTQCNVRRKCYPLALKLRVCLVWFERLSVKLTLSFIQLTQCISVRFFPILAIIFARTHVYEAVLSVFQNYSPVCFDKLLLDLFSQELNSLEPHENFRLWLTAESHPKFPTILLQSSLKVTYEVSLIFFQLKKKVVSWTDVIAKWSNTKYWKDTEQYSYHNTKTNYDNHYRDTKKH